MRVDEVLKDGTGRRFSWGGGVNDAIIQAARVDGYTARMAEPKSGRPITKKRVAARLAEFSDEELAAMGLSRRKGKK
jgi:hypothetical protein